MGAGSEILAAIAEVRADLARIEFKVAAPAGPARGARGSRSNLEQEAAQREQMERRTTWARENTPDLPRLEAILAIADLTGRALPITAENVRAVAGLYRSLR